MSNTTIASTSIASTTTSTNPVVNNETIARSNNTEVIILLRKLERLSDEMMDIVEEHRAGNETNPELIMERLNKYITLGREAVKAFYELPEEYRIKASKKTEEWIATLTGNFEDVVSSAIEFQRSLYNDLLDEIMNK